MVRRGNSGSLVFILFIVFGAVIGSVVSELARGSLYFDWLSFGQQFGISTDAPFSMNLGVINLKFGLMFNITIATIISVITSIIVYRRL